MDARRTMILCLVAKTFCIMQTHHSFYLNLDCSWSICPVPFSICIMQINIMLNSFYTREKKKLHFISIKTFCKFAKYNYFVRGLGESSNPPLFHRIENSNIPCISYFSSNYIYLCIPIIFSATSSLLPYLTLHMQSIGLTIEEIAIIYLALPFTTFLSPPLTGNLCSICLKKITKPQHTQIYL